MGGVFADGAIGWSLGYTYAKQKTGEEEANQGKNHLIAALFQCGLLGSLGMLVNKINEALPDHPYRSAIKTACNIGPFLAAPAILFFGAVSQGEYESLAQWFNSKKFALIKIPEQVGAWLVKFSNFISEYSGHMVRVAMVVGSVVLIALGHRAYGIAVLTGIMYQTVDSKGFIPRRISLFMEMYMPIVSDIGILFGGTAFTRVFSALHLVTELIPSGSKFLHQRIDAIVRWIFKLDGPSLKESDAPLIEKKIMNFAEIEQILEAPTSSFKVNPAHYSRPLADLSKLPKDNDFSKFLPLFDAVDWKSKYALVGKKLKVDDNFLTLLKIHFGKKKKEIKADFEFYIDALAKEKGLTKEAFAAQWTREQFAILCEVLLGQRRAKGSQQDVQEAIEDCEILLPHITSLKKDMDKEDALLKLAVEAGNYCGRAIKRTSNDLIRSVIEVGVALHSPLDDPLSMYEMQILQALQNRRHLLIQQAYHDTVQKYVPGAISEDVHGFDMYRNYFSLGFYPLTAYERRRFGLAEFVGWEIYNRFRVALMNTYETQVDQAVKDIGEVFFGEYVKNLFQKNDQLTDDQKEKLLDKFIYCNNGKWTQDETIERFHRVMFVRLGVLKQIP